MRFGLLGSLEVIGDDGEPIDVGGSQPRTVLAMLLAARGQIVSVDSILDTIWGENPPASASGTLQSYVSRLRRALEPGRNPRETPRALVSDPPGYRLHVEADDVDFRRFELLADDGRALLDQGDALRATERFTEALALWRGSALVEFAEQEFARGIAARLEERRLVVLEERAEAELRLGHHGAMIGELAELVERQPLREGLRAHLALALYRSGRQAEALRAIDEARHILREELGIDPGRPIRDLESRILAHDPSLDVDAPAPGSPSMVAPAAASTATRGMTATATTATAAATPWAAQSAAGIPAGPEPVLTLVGRSGELAQLLASLDHARAGRTRWALVEGEPGIGKTSLLEALAAQAAGRGAHTLWGRCYEGDAAPSFWPWLGILRSLVDALSPEERDRAVAGALGQLLHAAGSETEPGPGRFQVFEAVADVVARVARRQPVVAIFDDLQWADPASLELIEFLAQRLRDAPLLVAGSLRELEMGRNDAVVAAVATVGRQAGARRLQLRGLGEDETGTLVERATGNTPPPEIVAAIHRRAEGNPFFVGELARLMADTGDSAADVPAGVRDVVRRRLARLPDATVELLTVAAVIGRDVELRLLTRASGLSVDRCLDDLEPAVLNRLLLAVPDQPSTFRFSHALVREVVLDDASPLRRARFHQRVADAIVAVAGPEDDDSAEIVAEHLWAAVPLGLERRAADALERGADVAVRRFAYEAADDMLERAVHLRRAAGADLADAEAELQAISRLAAVRRMRHGYGMGAKPIPVERAKELATRTGRIDVYTGLLWSNWAAAATACNFAVAEPLAAQLLELGLTSKDPVLRAMGLSSWGVQCWHGGRMREAAAYLDFALAVGDASGLAALLESGPLVRCFHLEVHELLGDHDDGEARFDRLAAEQTGPFGRMIVNILGAFTGSLAGDAARARKGGEAAVVEDPDESLEFFGGAAQMLLGWAMAEEGNVDEGLALLRRGKQRYTGTGARTILPFYLTLEGLVLSAAGRQDEATAAIASAHDEIAAYGERWYLPLVLLGEARVREAGGAAAGEVRALVEQARAVADDFDIPLLVGRAQAALATLGAVD